MMTQQAAAHGASAWREGRLIDALAAYRDVLKARPDDWRAGFQLSWIDAAFGQLAPARARALDRPDLSEQARQRVRTVIAQAESGSYLDGTPADWDIGALDATGADQDDDWWLERGRRAWKVGLYGVAHECYERAARRSNLLYDDPPSWAQGALSQADHHLEAITGAVP